MEFNQTILTQNGRTLMAKAVSGQATIKFTKMRTSSSQYQLSQLERLTSLSNVKQTADVETFKSNGVTAKVLAAFDNYNLTTGYDVRTVGLYALDPDAGEILYAVSTASVSGYMPPNNGTSATGLNITIYTEVGNADNVNMVVDPAGFATKAELRALELNLAYSDSADGTINFTRTAYPSLYIGRGVKNSQNPADYKWERNIQLFELGSRNLIEHGDLDMIVDERNRTFWRFVGSADGQSVGTYNAQERYLSIKQNVNSQWGQWQMAKDVLADTELTKLRVGDYLTVTADVWISDNTAGGNVALGLRVNKMGPEYFYSSEKSTPVAKLKSGEWQTLSATAKIDDKYIECVSNMSEIRILLISNMTKKDIEVRYDNVKVKVENYDADRDLVFKNIKKTVEQLAGGNRNILRNTSELKLGDGNWKKGTWRKSGGGNVEEVTLDDTPVLGITKGVKITNTQGNFQTGIVQDRYDLTPGNYVLAWWVKGSKGMKVRLQTYWDTVADGGGLIKDYVLENDGWNQLVLRATITKAVPNASIGYIYVQESVGSIIACAPTEYFTNGNIEYHPSENDLILSSYPINSLYYTESAESPETTFGGKWTKLGTEAKFSKTFNVWQRTQ